MNDPYYLSKGAHTTADDGRCAMEWAAYLAGEPHSDEPVCVSQLLRGYCISLNDTLPDDKRQKLRPYLARTIGTAEDGLDDRRAWLAMDWLIRTYTPAWLELSPTLVDHAEALRSLPPVLAIENVTRAMEAITPAKKAAAAARVAARDAAGDAAWDAAGDAARDAARDAAWAAAGVAARDAAGDAAWAALAPTVDALQDSAIALLDRMLPTELVQIPVVGDWQQVCELIA